MKKTLLTLTLAISCINAFSAERLMSPRLEAKNNQGKLVEYKDLRSVTPDQAELVTDPAVIARIKAAMGEDRKNAIVFDNIIVKDEEEESEIGTVTQALVVENSCNASFGVEALDVTHYPAKNHDSAYDVLNSIELFVDVDYLTDKSYDDSLVSVSVYAERISTGEIYLVGASDVIVESSVFGESAVSFGYNIGSEYANKYYLYADVKVNDLFGTACVLASPEITVAF